MASVDMFPVPAQDPAFAHVETTAFSIGKRKRTESHIPTRILDMGVDSPPKLDFDPSKHLAYVPPSKIWKMVEIGKVGQGISPNAVSEPFQLFTEDAVRQMRAEILSKDVMEKCQYSSNLAHCQLRGFAPE